MKKGIVTTSMVADELKIKVPNASVRLKKMLDQGLLLGEKEAAETGGLEYNFLAIK
jgi:Mn-dependent DtxR family transcriptional regulator